MVLEIRLPAPAAVPPITLLALFTPTTTPELFGRAAVSAALVPM